MRKVPIILLLLLLSSAVASFGLPDNIVKNLKEEEILKKADIHFKNKKYSKAIEEYEKYKGNDKKDYVFFQIGMSKKAIGEFCVSMKDIKEHPKTNKKKYGNKFPLYYEYLYYIEKHQQDFQYYDSGAFYIYKGNEFQKIINMFPESKYIDKSAFELFLISRIGEWEGFKDGPINDIDRCKRYIKNYPDSPFVSNVLQFCTYDYFYLLNEVTGLSNEEKIKYTNEAIEFYNNYIKDNKNIDIKRKEIDYLKKLK